jgi:hypothetical protein
VELLYQPDEKSRVEVRYRSQSYGFLHAVDVHVNCRVKRNRHHQTEIAAGKEPPAYHGGALWSKEKLP